MHADSTTVFKREVITVELAEVMGDDCCIDSLITCEVSCYRRTISQSNLVL